MVDFAHLPKHLEDENRRRDLLDIERRLKEHRFPPQLVIENTSICNLTCIHCSHRELIRKKRHMERSLWCKIAEEVGREVSSNGDLADILRRSFNHGLQERALGTARLR